MVLRGTGRLEAGCDLAADLVVTAGWLGRTGRGAPFLPLHRKNLSQLHRLEGSQGTWEPGAPGKGRSASSVTSKAPAFGPGCSRAAWTAGLSKPRTAAILAAALPPDTVGPVPVCRALGSALDMTWFSLQLSEQTSVKLQKSI